MKIPYSVTAESALLARAFGWLLGRVPAQAEGSFSTSTVEMP
jgi:hypothetical protein